MKRYVVQHPDVKSANYPEAAGNPAFKTPSEKYAEREKERQARVSRNRT